MICCHEKLFTLTIEYKTKSAYFWKRAVWTYFLKLLKLHFNFLSACINTIIFEFCRAPQSFLCLLYEDYMICPTGEFSAANIALIDTRITRDTAGSWNCSFQYFLKLTPYVSLSLSITYTAYQLSSHTATKLQDATYSFFKWYFSSSFWASFISVTLVSLISCVLSSYNCLVQTCSAVCWP